MGLCTLIECFVISGDSELDVNGYGTLTKKKNPVISRLINEEKKVQPRSAISMPQDFRRVSAIIDVDVIPENQRRVRLMKNGSDKPLGFYIRDGTSVRVTSHGLEKVPGIFISRLVPGGLAESTGLLAVNDEVLEVNGIEVAGKTLDQVTDMMVANSANLIITVKPVNQRNNISPKRGGSGRMSQMSSGSVQSTQSGTSMDSDEVRQHLQEDDEDVIQDHLADTSDVSGGDDATNASASDTTLDKTVIAKTDSAPESTPAAKVPEPASSSGSNNITANAVIQPRPSRGSPVPALIGAGPSGKAPELTEKIDLVTDSVQMTAAVGDEDDDDDEGDTPLLTL